MSIDVHWCPLMSIGIPFVWPFLPVITDVLEGWSNQWISSEVVYPFLQGNSVCIVVQASWENQESETAKWSKWHRANHPSVKLSAVNRSQLVSTSDSTVSIFRRTDTVQGLRRSTAFEPTGLKLHVKGALDTFLQERPASFHDSMWDIWGVIRKKRHHSSVDSSHAEGASVYFCFHMISLNFQGKFCKTCLRCVQEDRCVERFFLLRQFPHRAVQPRLRWIPHLISLGESYEKFIRTWENMWNCLKMS